MFHDFIRMCRPLMNRRRKRIREAGNRLKMDDMAIVQLGLTKEEFDKSS